MQPFREILVWQRAYKLALAIYKVSADFPKEERYGLTSQLRRAAMSVAANIVEGAKRKTQADFAKFLNIAESSAAETDLWLLFAKDLGFASEEVLTPLQTELKEVERMLYAFRNKVESNL